MRPFDYFDRTLGPIEEDLALDEALLIRAEAEGGPPVLRLWESPGLAVVLGASGRVGRDVRIAACRADGIPLARRASGGGTVLVGPGALNLTVVLPRGLDPDYESPDRAQLAVLGRIAARLGRLGPPVEVRGSGDLAVAGRKVAGSAQRRLKGFFLVHASLLYEFPLDLIARYLDEPDRQPAYREGRPHADFVANLGLPRRAIAEAIRSAWLPTDGPPAEATPPLDLVARLVAEKYSDPAWVERL